MVRNRGRREEKLEIRSKGLPRRIRNQEIKRQGTRYKGLESRMISNGLWLPVGSHSFFWKGIDPKVRKSGRRKVGERRI
jgi:hypothetical protein